MADDETPSLYSIDKKLDLIDQKVDGIVECNKDHETRIRNVEVSALKSTIILSLLIGGSSIFSLIAIIRSFMP